MYIGADLAAWLVDPGRQASGSKTAARLAQGWIEHPSVEALKRDLQAMETKTAQGVLAAAEAFMDRADLGALIRELIAPAAENPFFRPYFLVLATDIADGLVLYADPHVMISLGVTSADALAAKKSGKRGPTSIAFTGLTTVFRFLKAGGATLSFWEAPEIKADFIGEEGGHCRMTDRRRIEDGESVRLDGRTQSFVIEHATSDIVILQAAVQSESAPLTVEYDSESLAMVGAASTDEASSRVQMMVSLLRVMGRTDAAPLVARLIERSPFYTRWYLMRELLALDAEAALPVLEAMGSADPHPEVRAAAAETLALFFGDGARGEAA